MQGLLTANLVLIYTPTIQEPWLHTQKLPRLLELGASFLDAIALNPHHPARAQAQVLRALLESGIKGHPPSPQLPRHAATVLSPVVHPSSTALFPPPPGSGATYQQQQQWQQQQQQMANGGAGGGPGGAGASSALLQFQQMQQLQQGGLGRRGSLGNGMDQALTNVLDGLDPMFSENEGSFWEWGQLGTGAEVDWAAGELFLSHRLPLPCFFAS